MSFKPYAIAINVDADGFDLAFKQARSFVECLPERLRESFIDAFLHQLSTVGMEVSFAKLTLTRDTTRDVMTVRCCDVRELIASAVDAMGLDRVGCGGFHSSCLCGIGKQKA